MDELFVLGGEFVVYERLPYSKTAHEVYRGEDEEVAVQYLLGKEND